MNREGEATSEPLLFWTGIVVGAVMVWLLFAAYNVGYGAGSAHEAAHCIEVAP